LVRLANFQKLSSADIIIDYSLINQFNLSKSVEFATHYAKSFAISPALYSLDKDLLGLSRNRVIDTITLFANPDEPRRRRFLNELDLAGVKSQNMNNVFDSTSELYRATKILVNIRQTDHHDTLEELRVLPALRCGVIVISERSPLVELTRYSKYVIWGELDELPAIILDVQKNYAQWHARIFENPGFIKRINRISRRNELVSLNISKHINNQLLKNAYLENV
jgi:hypothetical protein